MRAVPTIALSVLLGGAGYAVAQTTLGDHSPGMTHNQNNMSVEMQLSEPGQGAFAVISEIIIALEADPQTDWPTVNISGLRDHLLDMDRLVTQTEVDETVLSNGLKATASGDADTIATLMRMVPAHAVELAKDSRWSVDVLSSKDSVMLTVTSDDLQVAARIKGLGFFGLMASQDHHRQHHLMMALGTDMPSP